MEDTNLQPVSELSEQDHALDERGLVQNAVRGDVEAFGELYQRHAGQIYRYIAYRVRPPSEAEDLTAQVFLNAWKAIGRYQHNNTPFLAWLYTIAHNQVVNFVKSKNYNKLSTPIEDAYDLEDENHYSRPDEQADRRAEFEELRRAVLTLPDDQQMVIYLRYVEEMGHSEISRLMNKPEVTVRGILFRAHEALRKTLKRGSIFGAAD